MKKQDQIYSVVFLRGLASLMVCYFHLAHTIPGFISETNPLRQIAPVGKFGVEIFFIISGFILPYSLFKSGYKIHNYFSFLLKRIIRIEPAYLFSIVLFILVNILSNYNPWSRSQNKFTISFEQILFHLGYLVDFFYHGKWINPVYWTLGIEFQFYIFLGLCFWLIIYPVRLVRYIFLTVFILSFYVILRSFPGSGSIMYLLRFASLFSVGIAAFYWHEKLIGLYEYLILIISLLFVLYEARGLENCIAGSFAVILISFIKIDTNPLINFFGKISYSLYLVHGLIEKMINLSTVFIRNEILQSFLLFIGMAASIGLAFLFYKFIEKPSVKFAKSINYS